MTKRPFTSQELKRFDRLTLATSSPNQVKRLNARFALTAFIEEVGKEKCEAMFAVLKARDAKRNGAA